MDVRWARIKSWHAIQHESDAGHSTYCGRLAQGEVVEDLSDPGKTCEACFRIVMRLAEAMGAL